MSLRTLLLGLLVLVAGATALILLPGGDEPEAPIDEESTVEASTPRAATGPDSADSTPADAATREQVVVPKAEAANLAADIQPPSEDADALLVRCTDRDSGDLLPGAMIYYLDQSAMSEETMWIALTSNASIAEVLTRYAHRYQANDQGEVKVPYSGDLALAGRHEGRFHVETLYEPKPGDVVELKLYQQPKLPVLVVDERGEPIAQASVVLRVHFDEWRMDMLRLDTDENGLATFEDFDIFGQSWDNRSLYVGIGETLLTPVEVAITEENIAADAPPVRLIMPAAGAVEVAVFDREGNPCMDEVIVRLAPDYSEEDELHGIGSDGRTAYASTLGGVARFDYVGLGQEVVAGAFLNGIVQPSDSEGRGPTTVGETVRIELHEDVSFPILTGRVLHKGEPLAGEVVKLIVRVLDEGSGWDEERNTELDESGTFRTQISELELDPGEGRVIFIRETIDGERMYARAALPSDFVRGEYDLGEFELQPEPLLISGQVVDAQGEPVAAARLEILRRFDWGEESDDFYWNSLGAETKTEADGSFRLTGIVEAGDSLLRLSVDHVTHLPTTVDITLGQQGLLVRMADAGALAGSILADEGFPVEVLNISIEYPSGLPADVEESLDSYADIDYETREFEFAQLPPGIARVAVVTDNDLELAVIDGVVVAAGGEPDPRLQNIDLRGRIFAHKLRVLGSDGKPVENVVVVEKHAEDAWHWGWQGDVTVVTEAATVDLLVFSDGYRRAEVNAVSGEAEVRLEDGIEIVVRWSGSIPELDGGSWGVDVAPLDGSSYSWLESDEQALDENGEARLTVSMPGQYSLIVTARIDQGWSSMSMHTDATVEIQVSESGNPVYRVSVTEETIEQAREMIKVQSAGSSPIEIEELGYGGG